MTKLYKFGFALFLLLYFCYVVLANIPAQWLTSNVVKAAPGISLGGITGTVWSGRAGAATVYVPNQYIDLGGVRWQVNVPALLTLRLCLDLDSQLFRGNVCRGLSGKNTIKQLMVDEFPMSTVGSMIGVELGGSGAVTINKVVVDDKGTVDELEGHATWMRARGNGGGGWFPLGSFAADLSANGRGGIAADIKDVDGEFELNLAGEVGVGDTARLNGTIKPRPEAPQPLIDALMVFTEALDDGSYKVTWPIGG